MSHFVIVRAHFAVCCAFLPGLMLCRVSFISYSANLVFIPQKRLIVSSRLPQLIPLAAFYDIPPFGPDPQELFHRLNERPAPHRNTFTPLILTRFLALPQVVHNPASVTIPQLIVRTGSNQPFQSLIIDQHIFPSRFLNLVVAAQWPHPRMAHGTGTHHVGVNVNDPSCQIIAAFHRRCVVALLPVRSLSTLSLIEFLSRWPSDQLHRFRNHIPVPVTNHEEVDVVRSEHRIQNA